ncbi:Serine/threonine-protein phosphatase 7 long form homolog [Linum perenne]
MGKSPKLTHNHSDFGNVLEEVVHNWEGVTTKKWITVSWSLCLLGETSCKELVTALIERWRPETNTFHILQGEATITLEDVEVLTGLPTRGHPVSVSYDGRDAAVICEELLGARPSSRSFHGHQVKISWVKEQFDRLLAGAPANVITSYARAYTWVLLGAVLLADRSGDLIPVHLLRLVSDDIGIPDYPRSLPRSFCDTLITLNCILITRLGN